MDVKAIAGYLNTKEEEIVAVKEMQYVYFVHVNGFRPRFVSKKGVEKFVAADLKKFNSAEKLGYYSHGENLGYCKSYGACPIWDSPKAKAEKAELAAMHSARRVPASHPAAAFFPKAA